MKGMTAQSDGWQHQAEHLTRTHMAFGIAAMAVADRAQQRATPRRLKSEPPTQRPDEPETRTIEIVDGPKPTPSDAARPQQDVVDDSPMGRLLTQRVDAMTARARAAEKRVAELEHELGVCREEVVQRDNENRSLEVSLDLTLEENTRLSRQLKESDVAADNTRLQFERMKAGIHAAKVERNNVALAVNEVHRRQQAEVEAMRVRHEAVLLRAAAAEKSLVDVRKALTNSLRENRAMADEQSRLLQRCEERNQVADKAHHQLEKMKTQLNAAEVERGRLTAAVAESNRTHQSEIGALMTRLSEVSSRAVSAETSLESFRQSLDEKIGLIENLLQAKDRELQQLKRSRSQQISGAFKLLAKLSTSDAALAAAEARIKSLTGQVAELEAKTNSNAGLDRPDERQRDPTQRSFGVDAHKRVTPIHRNSRSSASALLSATITFGNAA